MKRTYWLPAALAVAFALVILAFALVVASVTGRPFRFFTADVYDLLDAPLYTSFVSYLGVLVWWTAAVAGLLGGLLARLHRLPSAAPLLGAGAIGVVLALDDLFSVHEQLLPDFAGLPEKLVYAVYVIGTLGYLVAFRSFFRGSRLTLLVAAGVLLAVSVGADVVDSGSSLLEDGAKLLGASVWAALLVGIVLEELGPAAARASET